MSSSEGTTEQVVAVDLGGTFAKVALAAADGTLTAEQQVPTPVGIGADGLVDWLGDQLADLARQAPGAVSGFGVAVPGIVDQARGHVVAAPNLGWYDVDLLARLEARSGLRGVIAHDVRTGGHAEWRIGAGRGVDNLVFLPLGTGIAAAVVVDGRMLEAGGYVGEIGHMPVPAASTVRCACGATGCLETVASAAGVRRTHLALTGESADTGPETREIAELARAGDQTAGQAFAIAGAALAEALRVAITLFGPERIVIGGGLAGALDLLLPSLESELWPLLTFQRRPEVVAARLGARAGVIGAGLVGWERLGR